MMSAAAVNFLLSRQSVKFVQSPGPAPEHLDLILQAAMTAPDHGKLRPWRFSLIRDDAVVRLGELAIQASRRAGKPLSEEKEAGIRKWLSKVPLLVDMACRIDHSNTKVPEHERALAVGVAAGNMLNAAHMLGYGAFWSTGLGTYVDEVTEALGYDSLDYQFLGFMAIGTPIATPEPVVRPDYHEFVTEWK